MWFLTNNIDSHSIECALIMFINIRVLRLRSTDCKSSFILLKVNIIIWISENQELQRNLMKSSDCRTKSKYKSPYGCHTNSHCVSLKKLPRVLLWKRVSASSCFPGGPHKWVCTLSKVIKVYLELLHIIP